MEEPIALTAIEAQIIDDHLVIPRGLTPVYLHLLNGRTIAHVKGWTAAKEYDGNWYELYPLGQARHFTIDFKADGEQTTQDWYDNFGEPTKERMKDGGGELATRERVG